MSEHVQRDQPPGVPPLELTGERTLPDVPEENYWFRRHLAVYEWIAERVGGLRVADLACGEGYGADVLARTAADVVGVDANPEAHEHARLRYRRANLRFERGLVEEFRGRATRSSSCRRSSTSRSPGACWSASPPSAPVCLHHTPNRLTLAPPGAQKSDNPWHLREYTPAEYRALLRPALLERRDPRRLPRAKAARPRARAARSAGTGCIRALRLTRPFYDRFVPAISASDFELRDDRDLDASLDFVAVCRRCMSPSATAEQRPSGELGDLAIVLHSHMPYVEGFGT